MPVLAKATDYLAIWQLPIVLALAAVWIIWGARLMRRAVREHVGRREAELNRCTVIALLAGLGGAISGGIAIVLAYQVAQTLVIRSMFLAVPAAAAVFCLVSFLTVFASFQLPGRSLGTVWLRSFGPPLIVALVAAVPTVWVTYLAQENDLAKIRSVTGLQTIYKEITLLYARERPPASLEDLYNQNVKPPTAYRHPSRKIAFFYMPTPLQDFDKPSSKLLACDWADNHKSNVRAVLYANGAFDIADGPRFQELLNRTENKAFAAALKDAEKNLSPDK